VIGEAAYAETMRRLYQSVATFEESEERPKVVLDADIMELGTIE
jgi:hypothetical protein